MHKKDIEITENKEHLYKPRPDVQLPTDRHSRLEKRQSQMMEDSLLKMQMMEEQERRRAQRKEKEEKEEEMIRRELEREEHKRREQLEQKASLERTRRTDERERDDAERRKREQAEEEQWTQFREARRKQREDQRHARRIEKTEMPQALNAPPQRPTSMTLSDLQRQQLTLEIPLSASAGSRSSGQFPRSPRGGGEEESVLQEQLNKMEKMIGSKNHEIEELKKAQTASEAALEASKALVDSLRLRLERTERDVERAKQIQETRAQAADKEIALLRTTLGRFKSLRDCMTGELARINQAPLVSLNNVETRVALDRVLTRVDAAMSGQNWRSTKEEFTSCLFPQDELKDMCLRFPPKDPKLLALAASAPVDIVSEVAAAAAGSPSTPTSANNAGSGPLTLRNRLDPVMADSPTSYSSAPLPVPAVEPEAEKICALDPKFEIDYWQLLPTFGDLIGEGGYAEVYRADFMGKQVAVKKFKVSLLYNDIEQRE